MLVLAGSHVWMGLQLCSMPALVTSDFILFTSCPRLFQIPSDLCTLHVKELISARFGNTYTKIGTYTMEYYSAIKKNSFESVLMRWMKLEPIIQVK